MSRLTAAVALGVLVASAGCGANPAVRDRDPAEAGGSAGQEDGGAAPGRAPSVFDRALTRLLIEFEVYRITAPVGTIGAAESVWRLAPEPLPNAATALCLQDNGFRAGIGRSSDRPALQEALASFADVRSASDEAVPSGTRKVEIDLGPGPAQQVVFFYDRRGTAHGQEFVNARAKLAIEFETRTVTLRDIWLRITPALEEPPGPLRWVMTPDGRPVQTYDLRGRTFTELAFELTVPEGGFLILGPTQDLCDRPNLLGYPFFMQKDDKAEEEGIWRESLLILTPLVIEAPSRPEPRVGTFGRTATGESVEPGGQGRSSIRHVDDDVERDR